MRFNIKRLLPCLLATGLLAGAFVSLTSEGRPALTKATVTRVKDGDSTIVEIKGREDRVRLIGIDTPEKWEWVNGWREMDPPEPCSEGATEFLRSLVEGKKVCLEREM